jgi:hypothetical protein
LIIGAPRVNAELFKKKRRVSTKLAESDQCTTPGLSRFANWWTQIVTHELLGAHWLLCETILHPGRCTDGGANPHLAAASYWRVVLMHIDVQIVAGYPNLQAVGCHPGMELEVEAAGLDCGIAINQRLGLLD